MFAIQACRLLQRTSASALPQRALSLPLRPLSSQALQSLSLSQSAPERANHTATLATRSAAGAMTQQNATTPPPPSSHSLVAASSNFTSSLSNKISSRRTAQIARHFSSSPSPSPKSSSPPSSPSMAYTVRKVAAPNTLEHRVYVEQDGQPVSPFHDIPLYANAEKTVLNMVVEIPRWTNAKLEVCLLPFMRSLHFSSCRARCCCSRQRSPELPPPAPPFLSEHHLHAASANSIIHDPPC
jgi:inorganic pyrophosphatase